ncbi:MAG: PF20097 family protein [Atopostipes suicloacalis]|nr:PF20097 family protein [Atopostipes suicloacalis]
MKCPYCGEEMAEGFVQSARNIFWSTQKKKVVFAPSKAEDISIANGFNGASKESYFCRKCKKVIIDIIND